MSALVWFLCALLFLAIDLLAPHLVLLFFGIGAFGASLVTFAGFSIPVQLVVFLFLSLASLFLLRRKLAVVFRGASRGREKNAEPSHPLLGKKGRIVREIGPGLYEVEIGGSFWRAQAKQSLIQGSVVLVDSVEADDDLLLQIISAGEENSPSERP